MKNTCLNKEKPYMFISYSHEDAESVYPILNRLHDNGYRLWYDQHIDGGSEWTDDISDWLTHDNCIKFVIFISEHSAVSEYVKDEVNLARKYKKSCLVIYLEDVKLTGGMELQLDRWQSINYFEKPEYLFWQILMKGIPAEAIEMPQAKDEDSEFAKKYELIEVIGKGGSSTVYKAMMHSTGSLVSVKVANCNSKEENTRNMLMHNEKRALAMIQSPFVPKILDFGEAVFDGETRYFLVESFVSGRSLGKIYCPLSEAEIIMIALNVANTLRDLHSNGNNLVHCDIKPDNLILDEYNRTFLIDFGGCVTADSVVNWGTTSFAAPEQNQGKLIDHRSDIYSLGMTMKYLLEKEYLRANSITFKENIGKGILESVPQVSHILALIVERMIDERIDKRFQTIEELIITLEEFSKRLNKPAEMILRKNEDYIALAKYGEGNKKSGVVFTADPLPQLAYSAVLNLSLSIAAVSDSGSRYSACLWDKENHQPSAEFPPTPRIITVGI